MIRFLPPLFPQHTPVVTDPPQGEVPVKEESRRLDWAAWLVAFDRYAIAAEVTGQMDYQTALLHKDVVLEVVVNGLSDGKRPFLGVLYDEVVRSIYFCLSYVFEFNLYVAGRSGRTRRLSYVSVLT